MIEYHTVKHIDNSRLVRPVSPARVADFWRRVAAGGALAACLLVYTWQHFECIQLRYEVEQLESLRAQSSILNQQLNLEVDTLRLLGRAYATGGKELGLAMPVVRRTRGGEATGDRVLAQARTVCLPQRP